MRAADRFAPNWSNWRGPGGLKIGFPLRDLFVTKTVTGRIEPVLTYFVILAGRLNDGDKEGIPGTIVEAMATGLPVVTTRHAGIPEMVRDGEDGFVVAERDVTAIAQALLTLVDQPDLRALLGNNAARRARQKADVVHLTAELESIYIDAVALANENRY